MDRPMAGKRPALTYTPFPSSSRSDRVEAGRGNAWFVAGMIAIFVMMLGVTLYATGVYQQGIRPRIEPLVVKAKKTWEERQAKQAATAPAAQSSQVNRRELAQRSAEVASLTEAQDSKTQEPAASFGAAEEQAKQLVRVYERMRPKEAASIVEQLELPLAVEIIGQMNDRQAARILGSMAPERAARITRELRERSL